MQNEDNEQRAIITWVIGLAALGAVVTALGLALGASMGWFDGAASSQATSAQPVSAPVSTSGTAGGTSTGTAATSAATATDSNASAAPVAVAAPITLPVLARLYFDTGVSALGADSGSALAPIIAAAKAHPTSQVAISGYHDKQGNVDQNAELAKQRAIAVRDALAAGGIGEGRIELRKPILSEGGADDREARRVEISVQ